MDINIYQNTYRRKNTKEWKTQEGTKAFYFRDSVCMYAYMYLFIHLLV